MITPIATRLTKGSDLKKEIQRIVTQNQIEAGTIASCVGCVSKLSIRLAGANSTLTREEPFEIVSTMGTLTANHQHIHISVANAKGDVIGGHLLEGTIIDTTAELVVFRYSEMTFNREMDESTGYTELIVKTSSILNG
ncbi:DNA-binding protein [Vibrio sp. S4M6]|uniref:PPC domain-containing DNA-binding protein n=1 Tax=Vibrio sinus TaxID=2946865 RepID=UPI00202A260D|nr:PPC domain-containing DNA-binding protein [Vibrio sinus]MCL9780864.1 DNA-binding protein [Vibrio sinus]